MDAKLANKILIGYQTVFWLVCLIYFAIVAAALIAGLPTGLYLSFWGVFGVLFLTVAKLILFAEQFRVTGRSGFVLLSYLLILVIAVTVFLGSDYL